METEETDFAFRGSRDYLQGPTVFDHILSFCGVIGRDIDFSFNKRTNRNCLFTTGRPRSDARVVGIYRDADSEVFIVEGPTRISKRVPYDEGGAGGACRIEGDHVHVPAGIAGYTFIEKLAAAYKRLLLAVWGGNPGRFAFVRLQLQHVPTGSFTVKFERRLFGKFYQGVIIENDQHIGAIFFGEWP